MLNDTLFIVMAIHCIYMFMVMPAYSDIILFTCEQNIWDDVTIKTLGRCKG